MNAFLGGGRGEEGRSGPSLSGVGGSDHTSHFSRFLSHDQKNTRTTPQKVHGFAFLSLFRTVPRTVLFYRLIFLFVRPARFAPALFCDMLGHLMLEGGRV